MSLKEELSTGGVAPSGPCSAWPKERQDMLMAKYRPQRATAYKGPVKKMAGNLLRTAGQAVRYGKVSSEIREERYDTCKACPLFIEGSKRCSDCGCFMEAKTWVGGDPDTLCPQKKWSR
jgi:hypothetical protein